MNKVKIKYLLFLFLLSSKAGNSQIVCSPDKIYGDWYYFTGFNYIAKINVDSLKSIVKDTSFSLYKLTFLKDGNCVRRLKNKPDLIKIYSIDSLNCKIVYGRKRRKKYYDYATIEYLDEKCLFCTQWNPHGPVTIFYFRQ